MLPLGFLMHTEENSFAIPELFMVYPPSDPAPFQFDFSHTSMFIPTTFEFEPVAWSSLTEG